MKKIRSRMTALLLAAALVASLLPLSASAAGSAPVHWSSTIGGGSANLVTVVMGQGRTGELSLANNSVVSAVSPAALVNQKNAQANTTVVAAINGGFFDSYSGSPQVMDGLVINNKLVHTGRSATLGFTSAGTPMIDWVDFTGTVVKLGNGFTVQCGKAVNTYMSAPESIMLFNDHMTKPITVPATSTIVLIQNHKVTGIGPGGTFTVTKGSDVLVYNSAAAQLYKEWGQFPEVGMSASIELKATGTTRDAAWSAVETALTGGPVLVKNGVNVMNDSRNQPFYSDPKQRPDYVSGRSFVAITGTGMIVMGTATASMNQIANWVVAQGWQEAIALDGGGSCMLYANGAYYSSGRNLPVALTIVDRVGAGGLPAESNVGKPNSDIPDSWALAELTEAINAGLVPTTPINFQKAYQDNITRQDFCLLIWELMSKHPDIINLLYTKPEVSFTDVNGQTHAGERIQWVARLGLINGVGSGRFDPYATLTRAQAAKILALTVQMLGKADTGEQFNFSDRAQFPGWDQGWIDYCGVNKIMNGVGNNAFDPNGTFTRQQAILTMVRVYKNYMPK